MLSVKQKFEIFSFQKNTEKLAKEIVQDLLKLWCWRGAQGSESDTILDLVKRYKIEYMVRKSLRRHSRELATFRLRGQFDVASFWMLIRYSIYLSASFPPQTSTLPFPSVF